MTPIRPLRGGGPLAGANLDGRLRRHVAGIGRRRLRVADDRLPGEGGADPGREAADARWHAGGHMPAPGATGRLGARGVAGEEQR
jgi:hypothetical protein